MSPDKKQKTLKGKGLLLRAKKTPKVANRNDGNFRRSNGRITGLQQGKLNFLERLIDGNNFIRNY
jgi:hypothetical protein